MGLLEAKDVGLRLVLEAEQMVAVRVQDSTGNDCGKESDRLLLSVLLVGQPGLDSFYVGHLLDDEQICLPQVSVLPQEFREGWI